MNFHFRVVQFVVMTLHVVFAVGKSPCVGTCYSGPLFPENEDIFHGKHLKGHSYKDITTDDPIKCYRDCVQDCRCKACQMKDARCELLDEDKTSKADDFKDASGYVYFDLKQTMYKGKSHMVPPGVCYNGCCRSQPCMNGGTCEEHCSNPKKKFSCKCALNYNGVVCDKREFASCLDVMKYTYNKTGDYPTNDKYIITAKSLPPDYQKRLVYCDFKPPNRAWNLVESFSMSNINIYRAMAFHQNVSARKANDPNWDDHRHGLGFIQYIRSKSTMFRVTCDFPLRSSLVPDYLLGYLRDYDIIHFGDVGGKCFKFARINIRGKDFFNQRADVWQKKGTWHFHIDCVGSVRCGLIDIGCTGGEDNFGYYDPHINTTKCTEKESSTTQFWLGEEI